MGKNFGGDFGGRFWGDGDFGGHLENLGFESLLR